MQEFFDIRVIEKTRSHDERTSKWGNVFFTDGWNLYIDHNDRQHNYAMDDIGIYEQDILVSGCFRNGGIWWRCTNWDMKNNEQAAKFRKVIEEIIRNEHNRS